MRVYEAIAEQLRRAGVERVFGLMGEDTAKLIIELDRIGLPFVAARHENQAVGMADAYSRVTERLGVVILTSGPGFTNGLTLINTASRARSRVLCIVGAKTVEEDAPGVPPVRAGKVFPYLATCAAEGITAVKPRDAATVLAVTRQAIADAAAGDTVILPLAVELLEAEAVEAGEAQPVPAPAPLAPDPERIELVADLLGETWAASRPLILAGRGAVQAGAGPALRRLGELTGAALATTLPSMALFAGEEYDIGICGTFANSLATDVITTADLVLVFGATLNTFTTYGNSLFPKARVVQVDADEAAFGRYAPVDPELTILADTRLAAEALVDELEPRGARSTGVRREELRERIATFDPLGDFRDQSLPDRIDPRTLVVELNRILPRERTVVIDPGHHMSFTTRYLSVMRPQDFLLPGEAGSIGVGMGEAIGATYARPGVPCVLGVGDAALMMSIGDLETAVRYRRPVVVVCANDMALGAEVHYLDLIGQPVELATCPTPSFAAVAEAFGAEGHTIRTLDDVRALEQRFRQPLDGPVVLDCYINEQIRGEWVELLHGHEARHSPVEAEAVAS